MYINIVCVFNNFSVKQKIYKYINIQKIPLWSEMSSEIFRKFLCEAKNSSLKTEILKEFYEFQLILQKIAFVIIVD